MYGPHYFSWLCTVRTKYVIIRPITNVPKNIFKKLREIIILFQYIHYWKNIQITVCTERSLALDFQFLFWLFTFPTLRRVGGRPKNSHKKEGGGHFLFPPSLRLCFFVWGSSYRSLIIVWCARVKMPAIYSHLLPPPLYTPACLFLFFLFSAIDNVFH